MYAPSPRNATWLRLQRRYLDQSVGRDQYDLAVWLNRVEPGPFRAEVLAGRSDGDRFDMCEDHAIGLNGLMKFFLDRPDYDYYLVLDSDAFPFRPAWLEKTIVWLQGCGRLPERQYAAAVRVENLDTFPHPCVVFIKGAWLRSLASPLDHFRWAVRPQTNLVGYRFEDVGLQGGWSQTDGAPWWGPCRSTP